MIEVMTDLPERVLGLKASGEVTAEDYRPSSFRRSKSS